MIIKDENLLEKIKNHSELIPGGLVLAPTQTPPQSGLISQLHLSSSNRQSLSSEHRNQQYCLLSTAFGSSSISFASVCEERYYTRNLILLDHFKFILFPLSLG